MDRGGQMEDSKQGMSGNEPTANNTSEELFRAPKKMAQQHNGNNKDDVKDAAALLLLEFSHDAQRRLDKARAASTPPADSAETRFAAMFTPPTAPTAPHGAAPASSSPSPVAARQPKQTVRIELATEDSLAVYAKGRARLIVQLASHQCAHRLLEGLTAGGGCVASSVVFQSLLYTASSLLMTLVHQHVNDVILAMHRHATPGMGPHVVQLAPRIISEIPRLSVAASKYIAKDLVALGCNIDLALSFGTRVQELIRTQAKTHVAAITRGTPRVLMKSA